MKHGSPPVAPATGQLNEFKTSKVSSVESVTASSMEYSLEEANFDYPNETNSSYRREKTSCCKTTGWDVTFILASHVISSFFDIIVKWLFAVLLRKLFVSVEEREGASDGILGTVTSPLLEALFLDAVDFDIIIIIALLSMIPVALGAAYSQSAALNLASKMARKRRMSLLDSTLNSHLQQAQNESPAIILEHISVLFEYEARTKFQRMGEKYNIGMVIIVCMVLFWELMLLALAFVVCVLFAEFFMRSYLLKEPNTRRKAYIQDVNELILDILRNADIVAMHNMNVVEKNLLQTKEFPASSLDASISHIFFLTTFVVIFLMIVMPIATMLYARSLVDAEEAFAEAVNTLFSLMAFVLLLEESHKSFNRIALTSESDTAYQIALKTVQRALRTAYKTQDGHFDDAVASDDVCVRPGSLEFYQVTVQYPQTDRPAVSNISFTIPHGATMAIVAESGGGKSTLFRAASGLLPYLGQIRFGGLHLDEYTQHTIRASLGYVSQESKLFARSIRDNIWYGNASPPDTAKIWTVLEQLGLDAWVHSLRQGLDTELTSERMVSGGQAQRLQMARLLCREHVCYVLLDECMSALDPVMRAVVTRSLKGFLQDKTVLVITHSHDTVQDLCTQVLDLNKLQRGEQDAILSVHTYLASLTRLGKQRPAAPPRPAGIWGRAA